MAKAAGLSSASVQRIWSRNQIKPHLIIDNDCTHKHRDVKKWLSKHSRFHVHFTPTSSSWRNRVERFFADITSECIRDGSFGSVTELEKSIKAYIAGRNADPRPYRWVAEGKKILEKINRARTKLNKSIYESDTWFTLIPWAS